MESEIKETKSVVRLSDQVGGDGVGRIGSVRPRFENI